MKITRLKITNYRGVRELDIDVPPAGAVIKGRNGEGKTSVLKAIGAALAAQGVGPDAIRLGEDRAEILVDMDTVHARRTISQRNTSVALTTPSGDPIPSPQTYLNDLLGTAALDPLAFYLSKPAEQRKLVLEAIPVRVTAEMMKKWTGLVPQDATALEQTHGLLVLETLRKRFYTERAAANKDAKTALEAAKALPNLPEPPAPGRAAAELRQEVAAASQVLTDIRNKATAAQAARGATARTREKAARLRAQAGEPLPLEVTANDLAQAVSLASVRTTRVRELEAELAEAKKSALAADDAVDVLEERIRLRKADVTAREGLIAEAEELELSLAEVDAMEVLPEDILGAEGARDAAVAALQLATQHEAWAASKAAYDTAMDAARSKMEAAGKLDKVVDVLTNRAPIELSRAQPTIEGLTITDDRIMLDGVSVEHLSGAEQMRFAVDLAKRLNAKAKILVCDGLERLDSVRMLAFVQQACADGWQLIATRVADGALVVEAITWTEAAS